MAWEAWFTLGVVLVMFLALARGWSSADVILWVALTSLIAVGALSGSNKLPSASRAAAGLSNSGLVTIAFLFIIVEGLSRTGATTLVSGPLSKLTRSPIGIRPVLLGAVATISAFLNNTAIVAMFLPITQDLCRRAGLPPAKLFLPMCYAATLGGLCTLMGTSTNLLVDGLLRSHQLPGLGLFELAWVGLPMAVVGIAYLLIASRYLLPDRQLPVDVDKDPREYSVELVVDGQGPLVGKSIEAAGLRHLPGLYLAEILRDSELIVAAGPQTRLQAGDQLVFFGVTDSVVDLRKIPGLLPAIDPQYALHSNRQRLISEVVVAPACPLVGKLIRESDFRQVYDAVVIAVGRDGRRITSKIGDIRLQGGDCLLLEAPSDFSLKHRLNRHFYLVSSLANSTPPIGSSKRLVAILTLACLVLLVSMGVVDLLLASMLGSAVMLLAGCCTPNEAKQSIEWSVLLVIGAALGIADALQSSGAAARVAEGFLSLAGNHPLALLAAVYLATMLATELITNNAAAALMFPIALKAAEAANLHAMPLVVAVMMAASCGFATPFGYQTNLMVCGPGGYQFNDYLRFGAPLDLLMLLVAVTLIPFFWHF